MVVRVGIDGLNLPITVRQLNLMGLRVLTSRTLNERNDPIGE